MTHEYYVSLEVAKLLREAGFDWECRGYFDGTEFHPNGSVECTNYNSNTCKYLKVPTLDVAQRWLREEKSFMMETTFITDEYSILYQANLYEVVSEKSKGRVSELISVVKGQSELKRTYEEAQEAGIKKALEIILNKEE